MPHLLQFVFHERALAFLDTSNVLLSGEYYEGDRVVKHFETRTSACKIDARDLHLAPRECHDDLYGGEQRRVRARMWVSVWVSVGVGGCLGSEADHRVAFVSGE